ncbi:MAG TPA: hypothetical protein VFH27_15790, partial [Longimicrobiaceae bacterium]|nr:hypothetical protein [Longimicrobiaceae bacterium]
MPASFRIAAGAPVGAVAPRQVLALQRSIGNRAVMQLLARAPRGAGGAGTARVQRAIRIGDAELSAGEAATQLSKASHKNEALIQGMLPALEAAGETFEDAHAFQARIAKTERVYSGLWDTGKSARHLQDLHASQRMMQGIISEDPESFRFLITTVGFEHEFAQMSEGPLRGVTHLELARSSDTMALTGLPWVLETDASNALELVSPPLALPAVGGRPLPHPGKVDAVDTMLRKELKALVASLQPSLFQFFGKPGTLPELLKAFRAAGLPLHALQKIHIGRENLTLGTDLSSLGNESMTGRLGEVTVVPSTKHDNGIDTQVNVATDLDTATRLDELGMGTGSSQTQQLRHVQAELAKKLPTPQEASPALKRFYPVMLRKLAGLFAVASEEAIRKWQQARYQAHLDGKGGEPADTDEYRFEQHSLMSSLVKDVSAVWVKDHLISLAAGVLDETDIRVLHKDLAGKTDLRLKLGDPNGPRDGIQGLRNAVGGAFDDRLEWTVAEFVKLLDGGTSLLRSDPDASPGVGFMEHDPGFIGARQDTYLRPDK